MWGMYILETIFGSLFAVCLILIIFGAICHKIYTKYKIKEPVRYIGYEIYPFMAYSKLYLNCTNYFGYKQAKYDKNVPKDQIKEDAEKIIKDSEEKYNIWKNNEPKFCSKIIKIINKINIPFIAITITMFLIFFILSLIIICAVGANPGTILKYQNMYSMIEEVINNGTDLENIAITQTKIEFNAWLVDVKTSLERWGNWSLWYLWKDQILALNYLI